MLLPATNRLAVPLSLSSAQTQIPSLISPRNPMLLQTAMTAEIRHFQVMMSRPMTITKCPAINPTNQSTEQHLNLNEPHCNKRTQSDMFQKATSCSLANPLKTVYKITSEIRVWFQTLVSIKIFAVKTTMTAHSKYWDIQSISKVFNAEFQCSASNSPSK